MVVLKDTAMLMLLIYSHSTCVVSKECVVKYDKNSYANIGTYGSMEVLGNNVGRNILQYCAIIGCDGTSFLFINRKINLLKEVLKKSSCSGLTECLGEKKSLYNADI